MASRETKSDRKAAGKGGPSGPASPAPAGRPSRFRGWRGWLVRLALVVAAPALVLGLSEAGLRLFGYGYDPHFFVRPEGAPVYVANTRFGERFFPQAMARTPDFTWMAARKEPASCRIFVLGSSAAFGVPDPAFNFGRILEVMLRRQYPGVRFEVVNAAMTAVNSHVVRVIAAECAEHEPDVFIVYMGNNEVIGPFGPGTVFQDYSANLTLIRASLAAKSARVGQLIGAAMGALAGRPPSTGWRGMEMFLEKQVAADDPRMPVVYDHFRSNLEDICRTGRRAGAVVLVSTVVTNLKDCAPLASVHREGLGAEDERRWRKAFDAGAALEAQGACGPAAEQYAAAAAIDDRYADLEFRRGRCAAAVGRFDEAGRHFVRARDLDALRFRADTGINDAIREAAAGAGDGVYLVDAERRFAEDPAALHGIVGNEWLYEHVHLRFEGNYLLARLMAERLAEALPPAVRARASGAGPPTADECAAALALTGWNRFKMARDMASLASRAPFTNQADHPARRAERLAEVQALTQGASPEGLARAAQECRDALRKSPDDYSLHANLGVIEDERRNYDAAVRQWRLLLERFPGHTGVMVAMGGTFLRAGRFAEAEEVFRGVLRIEPMNAGAAKELADALLLEKKPAEAVAWYRAAIRARADYADAHHNLAAALKTEGKLDEAAAEFTEALRIEPDAVGHFNLAGLLARQGKTAEALEHYQAALALAPDDPRLAEEIRRRIAALQAPAPKAGG